MRLRPVQIEEMAVVSALLQASAAWTAGRGQPLWPPELLTPEALLGAYGLEAWRLAELEGQAVATLALPDHDPLFWPDDPPGSALYLHKLAVSRARRGLAPAVLQAAVDEARSRGVGWLRLDTVYDRPPLRAIYERFGFEYAGERTVGRFRCALYQLRVG